MMDAEEAVKCGHCTCMTGLGKCVHMWEQSYFMLRPTGTLKFCLSFWAGGIPEPWCYQQLMIHGLWTMTIAIVRRKKVALWFFVATRVAKMSSRFIYPA